MPLTPGPTLRPEMSGDFGRLLIRCPDRRGIVAAVSLFLSAHEANIVDSNQFSTDPEGGLFHMRTTFHLAGFASVRSDLEGAFAAIADEFEMSWGLYDISVPKRVAIMASRADHCLLDLLWRARRGEIRMRIGTIISNHPDLAGDVRGFDVPYVHIPVAKDTKPEAEERQLQLLRGQFDLVVLARYMQVLSGRFLEQVGCPVINIHHSFLPAFAGPAPYERAKARGVKLIGATAHYVTEDLDEGPIIEQDVVRVSHRDSAADLQRKGADVERAVLSRAVSWHCDDRVASAGDTTVIF
jgi:formyltetrahydrofolate deformylase